MMTWDEVRAYIRDHYSPTQEAETWLSLRCEFPNAGFQTVVVALRDSKVGGPAFEVVALVGDTGRIGAVDALTYNHTAHLGALVLRGDSVLLRHVVPLKELTTAVVDEVLTYMASEATRLRMRTAIAPVPPELFSYMAS